MSRENVELVREGYAALNSGDINRALGQFDPEVEVHLAQEAGTVWGLDFEDTYYGVEGFLKFMSTLSEAWDEVRWDPIEYLDAGDRVLVIVKMTTRGRGSGIEVEQSMAHLCDVRAGKLARHETFFDRDAALAAAGLAD